MILPDLNKPLTFRRRISLRTFLFLVLVAGLVFGHWAYMANRQRKAVEEIRRIGGSVLYDDQIDPHNGHLLDPTRSGAKEWLIRQAGIDAFQKAVSVDLFRVNDIDLALIHAARLPYLTRLRVGLDTAGVSDASLKCLRGLGTIEVLWLTGNGRITDAGIDELASLTNLREVSIHSSQATDSGIARLATLSHLEGLAIYGRRDDPGFSDASLRSISALTRLKSLTLYPCGRITDEGLQSLRSLTDLEVIFLTPFRGTAAGVEGLCKPLPKLRTFNHIWVKEVDDWEPQLKHMR